MFRDRRGFCLASQGKLDFDWSFPPIQYELAVSCRTRTVWTVWDCSRQDACAGYADTTTTTCWADLHVWFAAGKQRAQGKQDRGEANEPLSGKRASSGDCSLAWACYSSREFAAAAVVADGGLGNDTEQRTKKAKHPHHTSIKAIEWWGRGSARRCLAGMRLRAHTLEKQQDLEGGVGRRSTGRKRKKDRSRKEKTGKKRENRYWKCKLKSSNLSWTTAAVLGKITEEDGSPCSAPPAARCDESCSTQDDRLITLVRLFQPPMGLVLVLVSFTAIA